VMFNASSVSEGFAVIGGMFGAGEGFVSAEFSYYIRSYGITIIIALVGSTPAVKRAVLALRATSVGEKIISAIEPIALAAVLIVSTAYLVDGSFNPFLYFRF